MSGEDRQKTRTHYIDNIHPFLFPFPFLVSNMDLHIALNIRVLSESESI